MLQTNSDNKSTPDRFGANAVSVRAAITGASCRLPGANTIHEFWELMCLQRHGLRTSPAGRYEALELTKAYIDSVEEIGHQWGGYIDDIEKFDPYVFGMSRAEASVADPQHRLMMEVVWEALENACEAPDRLAGTRTGVFAGLCSFDYAMFQAAFDPYGELVTPFSVPGAAHSIAANRISYLLDLHGPSMAMDAACASSSMALHAALRSLEQGECDTAIVCGANAIMTPYLTKGFARARMISKDGLVKCFDESTDGYVRAEGAVAVVLRRETDAVRRGNRIMGVISGSAINHDGRTPGLAAPNAERQIELIQAAHEAAGIEPSQVGFVEAHGTATYRGDETELQALGQVFKGDRTNPCYVGSVKANVGHLEATSGLAGLLKAVLCVEHGLVPGQANLKTPMAAAHADGTRVVVPTELSTWSPEAGTRKAGVSCLGFGGSNSHIVVEQAPSEGQAQPDSSCETSRPVHILKVSAKSGKQVSQIAARLSAAIAAQPELCVGDICHSTNIGRSDFEDRAVIVCSSRDDLLAALQLTKDDVASDRVFRGRAKRGGCKLAIVYADHTDAYWGMGRSLFESDPRFARAIQEIDDAASRVVDVALCEELYGFPERDGELIQDRELSRLVTFAVMCATAKLLAEIGVRPNLPVSFGNGEFISKVLSGSCSLEEAVGRLIEKPESRGTSEVSCAIEKAIDDGAHTVVVLGSQQLNGGEGQNFGAETDVCIVTHLDGRDEPTSWASMLGALYTAGVDLDWEAIDAPFQRKRLALPTYPFNRERFWFTDGSKAPGVQVAAAQDSAPPITSSSVEHNGARTSKHVNGVGKAKPDAVASREDVFEFVRIALADATALSVDEFSNSTPLIDVDIDSIAALGLMLQIEKKFGVMPDPELFGDDMTFGQAVSQLHALVAARGNATATPSKDLSDAAPANLNFCKDGKASFRERHAASAPEQPRTRQRNHEAHALFSAIKDRLKADDYLDAVRPDFSAALHEMLLDVDFDTAVGDRVSGKRYGKAVEAIDMLGGFGSTLFGHNHPKLVGVMQEALRENRPMFVQMSNRTAAGTLAKELSTRVSNATGRDFNVVFGSTGAEMVDAALKHALFEWSVRRNGFLARCEGAQVAVPASANERPVVFAVEGSYHGKTLGAYSLTWHAPGRDALDLSGPFDVVWLPRDDEAAAKKLFARYRATVDTKDGETGFSRIAGVFVEPIQGEGGIFPLATSFVKALRTLADEVGCPIVVDEIQSGIGRTGSFLASSLIGLDGDYYLFGKSLGGGLTKTTALLIDKVRYAEGYGFAHTSTFAEDDHGALVGLRALQLLDEDNVLERSRDAGEYLVARLREVQARYSSVIDDVRGCGLMVGIELSSQHDNDSKLIAGLSDQQLLGIFVASHLLHRCGVRVGTALSRPSTLRLEPSAYISQEEMDHVVSGIESVCDLISTANAGDFVRHLAQGFRKDGQAPLRIRETHANNSTQIPDNEPTDANSRRAIFLGHMITSEDIGLLDPSLLSLSVDERENLARRMTDPVLVKRMLLKSSCGKTLDFQLHSLPITSHAIVDALRNGQSDRIVRQVNAAVAQFADSGAQVVGLGGLLSVITRNGLAIQCGDTAPQITTGNTYTVALAAEAVLSAMREKGIDLETAKVGIVGAGGNIGSTLVQVLSRHFRKLRLVGRRQSIARVEKAALANYESVLARLREQGPGCSSGLAAALADSKAVDVTADGSAFDQSEVSRGARLMVALTDHYGEDPFVAISSELSDLKDCDVIVTASNAIAPILSGENVGGRTSIICDVSVPSDVDPSLISSRPDITVIRGGVARAPNGNSFTLDMINLPENHMLACMTETALLGFAGKQEFCSIGDIDADGVFASHELGRALGFNLGYSSIEKPVPMNIG